MWILCVHLIAGLLYTWWKSCQNLNRKETNPPLQWKFQHVFKSNRICRQYVNKHIEELKNAFDKLELTGIVHPMEAECTLFLNPDVASPNLYAGTDQTQTLRSWNRLELLAVCVMAALGCQHDNTWHVYDCVELGRPTLNLGHTFWSQPTLKGVKEVNFCVSPACPHSPGKFLCAVAEPFLHWY